jgi:hypothetical protein
MAEKPLNQFSIGETVSLLCDQQRTEALVILERDDSATLVLSFDGVFAGHLGTMWLSWRGDGYRSITNGVSARVTKLQH